MQSQITSLFFYIEENKNNLKSSGSIKTRKIDDESIAAFCNIIKSAPFDTTVTQNQNPESAFCNFFNIINEARDVTFPEIEIQPKRVTVTHSPWMSPGLLISQKQKLFSKNLEFLVMPMFLNLNNIIQYLTGSGGVQCKCIIVALLRFILKI